MQKLYRKIVRIPRDPFILRQFNNCSHTYTYLDRQVNRNTRPVSIAFYCCPLVMRGNSSCNRLVKALFG